MNFKFKLSKFWKLMPVFYINNFMFELCIDMFHKFSVCIDTFHKFLLEIWKDISYFYI